jgi:serine/threonine-protein kinase RsbW
MASDRPFAVPDGPFAVPATRTGVPAAPAACPAAPTAGPAEPPAGPAVHRPPPARPPSGLITWSRDFPGTPEQAGRARRFLAEVLVGSPLTDDAVLCLSELASNAILHSDSGRPGGTFTVRVSAGAGRVRLEVVDAGGPWPDPPSPGGSPAAPRTPAAPDHPVPGRTAPGNPAPPVHQQDRGRGLAIVAALAAAWGIAGGAAGRVAWCEFDLPVVRQRRRTFAESDIPHSRSQSRDTV